MNQSVWPEWVFGQPQEMTRQRNSVSAEFFNSPEVIPTDCVALIREAIQNSLDQRIDKTKPARVVISMSGNKKAMQPGVAGKYFSGLLSHLNALDVNAGVIDSPCNYLVFEDFQTTGLRGDPTTVKETGEPNDFMYFFRVEGRSNKQENKERGKWGIGKYVFPMSSSINTFFGYSIRENESFQEGNGLLFGQSTLDYHSVGDDEFESDGWWGIQESPGKMVTPFTASGKITEFISDWNLTRKPGETGLSVVIPYLRQDDKWELDEVVRAVIEDYFSPILRKQLIVTVRNIDGNSYDLNDTSIHRIVSEVFFDEVAKANIVASLEALLWAAATPGFDLETKFGGAPGWSNSDGFDAENLSVMRTAFERDGRIKVRIPVSVVPESDPTKSVLTHYELLLMTEHENIRHIPIFIRSGLMVKQASDSRIPSIRSFVLIDEPALSGFLGNAEGPAHITWSQETKAFKGKYKYGPTWLSFIKASPVKLLEKLRGDDAESDTGIAEEYFPIPHGKRGGTPPKPPAAKKQPVARIASALGGFSVFVDVERPVIQSMRLRAAFDVRRGNPFGKWMSDDFSFDGDPSMNIQSAGCTINGLGNVIEITEVVPADFELKVTGFDPNRDLRVEVEALNEGGI